MLLQRVAQRIAEQVQYQTDELNSLTFLLVKTDLDDADMADATIVTDAALTDDNKWYVVADPMIWDGIAYSYLAGENGVVMGNELEFSSGSLLMQARLAFDVKVIDSKALGYNAGA